MRNSTVIAVARVWKFQGQSSLSSRSFASVFMVMKFMKYKEPRGLLLPCAPRLHVISHEGSTAFFAWLVDLIWLAFWYICKFAPFFALPWGSKVACSGLAASQDNLNNFPTHDLVAKPCVWKGACCSSMASGAGLFTVAWFVEHLSFRFSISLH